MSILYAYAMAKEAAELTRALEGATKEEALAVGTFLGAAVGVMVAIGIVWVYPGGHRQLEGVHQGR